MWLKTYVEMSELGGPLWEISAFWYILGGTLGIVVLLWLTMWALSASNVETRKKRQFGILAGLGGFVTIIGASVLSSQYEEASRDAQAYEEALERYEAHAAVRRVADADQLDIIMRLTDDIGHVKRAYRQVLQNRTERNVAMFWEQLRIFYKRCKEADVHESHRQRREREERQREEERRQRCAAKQEN